MKKYFLIVCILIFTSSAFCQNNDNFDYRGTSTDKINYKIKPDIERIPNAYFCMGGKQKSYQDSIIQNWLIGIEERNPYLIEMYAKENKLNNSLLLPWSGEFVGKHIKGAVSLYRLTKNINLKKSLDSIVHKLCSMQTESGYLGPWAKKYEFTGRMSDIEEKYTWEAWNHYHIMIGLIEYYNVTGSQEALSTSIKIADRLCVEFLGKSEKVIDPKKIGDSGFMEHNLTPAHSLCILYKITGTKRYLDLAEQIVEKDFLKYGNYINNALEGKSFAENEYQYGNRWERLHTIMSLSELYWITGKAKYRKAFETIWNDIADNDIHNSGAFSSDEMAIGQPYGEGWIETCCTIGWETMCIDMLRINGDSKIADLLELAHFNTAYASWDESGKWCTYHTGTSGVRKPSTEEIAFQIRKGTKEINCCSANSPNAIGLAADWAIMKQDKTCILNWYGPSEIGCDIKGSNIRLIQETNYPYDSKVLLVIKTEKIIDFELKLRIPFWSNDTQVMINGKKIKKVIAGEYLVLNRKWKNNDVISINFDMSPRFWLGKKQYKNRTSIYIGPILLAYQRPIEPIKLTDTKGTWNTHHPYIAYSSDTPTSQLTFEFEGNKVYVCYDKDSLGGKTEVLIDDIIVDTINHYSHSEKLYNYWESSKLTNKNHTLKLNVIKNNDINNKIKKNVKIRDVSLFLLPIIRPETLKNVSDMSFKNNRLLYSVFDTQNREIQLIDFDSAGDNGRVYHTWIPIISTKKIKRTYRSIKDN